MSLYTIPLSATAPQTVTATLSGQSCTIDLDWRPQYGLFMSVTLNGNTLCSGRLCLNDTPIIRRVGTALPGDLYFHDTQGNADPELSGLGTRWELIFNTEIS
ncbi:MULTISPECIES: phage baseplate plug protein [unclassified Saccharibacter]|uniref:phage baseplate plug family protein n=1 Tax=unclassified Saccharibacter TaxID=2648722 RepID=UPI001328AF8B|nr:MULTISPECIES: hypothetical protein [unclassified Saccharibacter]MXV35665.1 hypothetical protein [Saccharibacter sp. EH611]MXV58279.1 hypothetical protein [Saccharibacter sp. EH70]MXV66424.1 hypothetical protein [Saccharibacter sp. EH60]